MIEHVQEGTVFTHSRGVTLNDRLFDGWSGSSYILLNKSSSAGKFNLKGVGEVVEDSQ